MVKIHGSYSLLHVASPCLPKDVFIFVYIYTQRVHTCMLIVSLKQIEYGVYRALLCPKPYSIYLRVAVCICMFVCVCVCACMFAFLPACLFVCWAS